jgi:RNA polymerase sigma-70 factor (ECF subfamily)
LKDEIQFEQIVEEYGPAIARIAASFESELTLREDLIQDIGIAILTSIGNYSGTGSIKGFVLRIAHNKAIDHVAKEATRKRYITSSEEDLGISLNLENKIQLSQEQTKLICAINRLSLPLKEAMTLLLEDMSYKEIAEILGISVSNVGIRVSRAKTLLLGDLS